jgi:hypothetical protein
MKVITLPFRGLGHASRVGTLLRLWKSTCEKEEERVN